MSSPTRVIERSKFSGRLIPWDYLWTGQDRAGQGKGRVMGFGDHADRHGQGKIQGFVTRSKEKKKLGW
jgi:hypothetical protein